jgi:Predicted transcriptional regulators
MVNRLKEFREKAGISQEELAEKADVSRATISLLENCRAEVTKTTTLTKLADTLGGSVAEIFFSGKNPTC